jgi:hypothetical protein
LFPDIASSCFKISSSDKYKKILLNNGGKKFHAGAGNEHIYFTNKKDIEQVLIILKLLKKE